MTTTTSAPTATRAELVAQLAAAGPAATAAREQAERAVAEAKRVAEPFVAEVRRTQQQLADARLAEEGAGRREKKILDQTLTDEERDALKHLEGDLVNAIAKKRNSGASPSRVAELVDGLRDVCERGKYFANVADEIAKVRSKLRVPPSDRSESRPAPARRREAFETTVIKD